MRDLENRVNQGGGVLGQMSVRIFFAAVETNDARFEYDSSLVNSVATLAWKALRLLESQRSNQLILVPMGDAVGYLANLFFLYNLLQLNLINTPLWLLLMCDLLTLASRAYFLLFCLTNVKSVV